VAASSANLRAVSRLSETVLAAISSGRVCSAEGYRSRRTSGQDRGEEETVFTYWDDERGGKASGVLGGCCVCALDGDEDPGWV